MPIYRAAQNWYKAKHLCCPNCDCHQVNRVDPIHLFKGTISLVVVCCTHKASWCILVTHCFNACIVFDKFCWTHTYNCSSFEDKNGRRRKFRLLFLVRWHNFGIDQKGKYDSFNGAEGVVYINDTRQILFNIFSGLLV